MIANRLIVMQNYKSMKLTATILAVAELFVFAGQGKAQATTATVSWNTSHQTIDGFGAFADHIKNVTTAQTDLFFSTNSGVGFSLLRVEIPPDGTVATTKGCAFMQQAVARGVRVWASSWSPPASMKTNNNVNNGGYLLAGSYQAYADYLASYVQNVKSQCGVELYALSVQNEPDMNTTYASCLWTATNLQDFITNNLGPTLAKNGIATKLMLPEHSPWDFPRADATMHDSTATSYVSIVATHDYGDGTIAPYPLAQNQGKHLWETEVSDYGPVDTGMVSAINYANKIHNTLVNANGNAWHYWWLLGSSDNEALIPDYVNPAKRLYAIGNYSRFVRPGWVCIDATKNPASGISISAFKDPSSGQFAIVAINDNYSNTSLSFPFSGFTAGTVTPWITDATRNLAQQSSVTAGSNFTYSLPARSITTFVGTTTSAYLPNPFVGRRLEFDRQR